MDRGIGLADVADVCTLCLHNFTRVALVYLLSTMRSGHGAAWKLESNFNPRQAVETEGTGSPDEHERSWIFAGHNVVAVASTVVAKVALRQTAALPRVFIGVPLAGPPRRVPGQASATLRSRQKTTTFLSRRWLGRALLLREEY